MKSILFKSTISAIFSSLTFAYICDYFFKKSEVIIRYTIIPIYLLLHLLIEFLICMLMVFIILIIIETITYFKGAMLFRITVINDLFKNFPKLKQYFKIVINFINKNINPIYTISLKKINIVKLIKKVFIFNYLIAGFIMISPMTNYINEEIEESYRSNVVYENFKNDYELYKDIFFVSLIPYSLTYIFKKER